MLSKLLLGLTLFAATTSMAFAQCSCSSCSGGVTQGAYQNVTGHCGCGPGQSCADCGTPSGFLGRPACKDKCACVGKCHCGTPVYGPCGNAWPERPPYSPYDGCGSNSDWDHPYFDCCKPCVFDLPYCDPCCRKPYVSVFGGYTVLEDITFSDSTQVLNVIDDGTTVIDPGPPPVFSQYLARTFETTRERGLSTDEGYAFGGAIGYRVHPVVRMETEFAYRENDAVSWFERVSTEVAEFNDPSLTNGLIINRTVTETILPATGTIRSYSAMFNLVADFSIPRVKCLNLYLGGGIGAAYLDGEIEVDGDIYRLDSTSFAYQLIAGGNVPLTQHLEAFVEYRYLGADNISIDDVTNTVSFGKSNGVDTQNAFFGVRVFPHR